MDDRAEYIAHCSALSGTCRVLQSVFIIFILQILARGGGGLAGITLKAKIFDFESFLYMYVIKSQVHTGSVFTNYLTSFSLVTTCYISGEYSSYFGLANPLHT